MITFDGDRSKKRTWFAKKQLAVIEDIDIPAKVVKWDGFTFKVWQIDDLSGGRVTAPMGAVVLMSTHTGIKVAVADYWAGGFTSRADLHMLYAPLAYSETKIVSVNNLPVEDMTAYSTVLERPMGFYDPFGNDIDGYETAETVYVRDRPAFPMVLPYQGAEAFWVSFSDPMFVDTTGAFNEEGEPIPNGTADYPITICESSMVFYASDNSNLGGRRTMSILDYGETLLLGGTYQPWKMMQYVSPSKSVIYHGGLWYDTEGTQVIIARTFDFPTTGSIAATGLIPSDSMPGYLRDIMFDVTDLVVRPQGSYACSVAGVEIFLHGVDATLYNFPGASGLDDYYTAHPEDENWKLFFVLKIGSISHVISSSQFMDLLDNLADAPVSGDWHSSQRMFEQFFPNPNNNYHIPYDSIMFHSHTEDIYSWSRKYGLVRFSQPRYPLGEDPIPAGIYATSLVLPIEVTGEEGVVPNITYAGTFEEDPFYLCICECPGYDGVAYLRDGDTSDGSALDINHPLSLSPKKQGVRAIYYGNPFDAEFGWTALPWFTEKQTLIHARPVKVTPTEIFLVGVIKVNFLTDEEGNVSEVDENDEGYENSVPKYFFASLHWTPDNPLPWQRMAMLPFDGDTIGNFSAGLFGEHPFVNDLSSYPSRPTVRPQIPVGPYSKYAIGMP
jgi:hypothetical protein